MKKILQIGNYPPPMCGWAMQTVQVTKELQRRGHVCEVLNINENRRVKNPDCVDVQNGFDYLTKILHYALRGYGLNAHVNGMSWKGYWLALGALLVARITGGAGLLTFHGGFDQIYFPRQRPGVVRWSFWLLFSVAGRICCDGAEIKQAIESYGIDAGKIGAIPTFSSQYTNFVQATLDEETEKFLASHQPVIFSYMSFRPEYELDVVREGMKQFRKHYPAAGFVWLGFPNKEMAKVEAFIRSWAAEEQKHLLLLGNLTHDRFLTLLSRCAVNLRTPACDGVAASVLEALALGVPVVASENGRRPAGAVTYNAGSSSDMCAKLSYVLEHRDEVKSRFPHPASDDNVGRMADWLLGDGNVPTAEIVTTTTSARNAS